MNIDFLFCLLAQIGLTFLLVNSRVFEWYRLCIKRVGWVLDQLFCNYYFFEDYLSYLVNCYTCTGFWVGFFWNYQSSITNGLVVSLLSQIVGNICAYLYTLNQIAKDKL